MSGCPEDRDLLFDPYYSWWTAQALLRETQPEDLIAEFLDKLPYVVTLAVGEIGVPQTVYEEMIVAKTKDWVRQKGCSHKTPESIRAAAANSFIFIDSLSVLEIVIHNFELEVTWLGDFARFRNGDTYAGIRYAEIAGIGEGGYGFWEQLVEHARLHHRDRLVADLNQILVSSRDERQIKGALVLAGFLALPEVCDALREYWEQTSKTGYLLETLWAALRCSLVYEDNTLLKSLAVYWAELPDIEGSRRDDVRRHVANRLARVLAPGATTRFIAWLLQLAEYHKTLRDQVAYICGLIDLPDAIEHAVRYWSVNEGDVSQRSVEHHWGHLSHPKLSPSSVERLRALWDSSDSSDSVKELAFSLWCQNVNQERIEVLRILREVDVAEPFFTAVIAERARLGDMECVAFLIPLLKENSWLFSLVHHVWCTSIRDVVSEHLSGAADTIPSDFSGGNLDEHYDLSSLLMRIPITDAEALIKDNWEHLRFSRLFVQGALFIGTSTCVSMAQAAIDFYPADVDPLEHIDFHFGFGWGAKTYHSELDMERLMLLEPYLDRLADIVLRGYADAFCRHGSVGYTWCEKHLPTTFWLQYRKQHYPTDENIAERLSVLTTKHPNVVRGYVEEFIERKDGRRLISVLGNWLAEAPTVSWRHLEIAGIILEMIGTRSDLVLLDMSPDPAEGPWAARRADGIRHSVSFSVRLRSLQ